MPVDPRANVYYQPFNASRAPCPALNALANHGYLSREGRNLTFLEVLTSVAYVYNLSHPLALLLTFAGFITCGRIRFGRDKTQVSSSGLISLSSVIAAASYLIPRVTLDLGALAKRGSFKIAHDASFVHPKGIESTSPHPELVDLFVSRTTKPGHHHHHQKGATLVSLARFHASRLKSQPISAVHEQIAQGECALAFLVLRGNEDDKILPSSPSPSPQPQPQSQPQPTPTPMHLKRSSSTSAEIVQMRETRNRNIDILGLRGAVPAQRLKQWFGEERLPDKWWPTGGKPGVRPAKTVGLVKTMCAAWMVAKIVAQALTPPFVRSPTKRANRIR